MVSTIYVHVTQTHANDKLGLARERVVFTLILVVTSVYTQSRYKLLHVYTFAPETFNNILSSSVVGFVFFDTYILPPSWNNEGL